MKRIFLLVFLFVFSSVARAAAVPPKVDHRGLVEIPGVLRAHTGHHWGAANLVVWGPNWQGYAQQDYAMKDLKKWSEGGATRVTGLLQYVGKGVRVDETLRPDKLGGNLCFDANFLTKEQADRAVRDFTARGWNAIRFHHIDVTPGNPNATMIYELAK